MKKTYVQPKLTELGALRELTLGASTGKRLDGTYQTGTLTDELTFS
jgi:hypothetical protein